MKCLSICQPFAELIIQNKKTIELRKWNTKIRGEFLVHAPIKIRKEAYEKLKINEKLTTGAIIGKVELVDVKKYESLKEIKIDKKKHFGSTTSQKRIYGFILKNAKPFRIPIPWKGQLGFFDVDLPKMKIKNNKIVTEMIEEEFTYQWVGHH
ncbi:ASCH domain-containing protein [Nitrosopumilus sp.]|jgi:predicted transcriptional regulator|nr:ASCH domain-containing protein [Nitrosopumilus sp.]|tara:strand:+ start:101 stop:556 length:456 start_codon:yes stop_codon:yes gene_type:complete